MGSARGEEYVWAGRNLNTCLKPAHFKFVDLAHTCRRVDGSGSQAGFWSLRTQKKCLSLGGGRGSTGGLPSART